MREDPQLFELRVDLADLYIKLKAFDESKRALINALRKLAETPPDIDQKSKNVTTLLSLAKVYLDEDMASANWKFKENVDAKQALMQA